MMKLVLVVLSMLYGTQTQSAESVSGCNPDIIESLSNMRTASLVSLHPRAYFAAVPTFLSAGYNSAKADYGIPANNKAYAVLIQCNEGEVVIETLIKFTQETETRIEGVGFPVANATLDYYVVECTDGLILIYICDPTQIRGSGTEAFAMVSRTNEPVSTEAFEACSARAQEAYSEVEFTTVNIGECEPS